MSASSLPNSIIFAIIAEAESSLGGSHHRNHKKKFFGVLCHFNVPYMAGYDEHTALPNPCVDFDSTFRHRFDREWVYDSMECYNTPLVLNLFEDYHPDSDWVWESHESGLIKLLADDGNTTALEYISEH